MDDPILQFFVEGVPKQAGSKKAIPICTKAPLRTKKGLYYGRSNVVDDCDNKAWIKAIKAAANANWADGWLSPLSGPLVVEFKFWMKRPKAHYGSGRNAGKQKNSAPREHITAPDATKLLRCAEDALTGIIWDDDAQIVRQVVSKEYVPNFRTSPGVWIAVWRNT